MAWFVEALEIANAQGNSTGRWRMTAWSDDGGGGPFGDMLHDHATAAEAQDCETCEEYTSGITGMPSRKKLEAEPPKCDLCGQPMPKGEETFRYHGYSGPCPTEKGTPA